MLLNLLKQGFFQCRHTLSPFGDDEKFSDARRAKKEKRPQCGKNLNFCENARPNGF